MLLIEILEDIGFDIVILSFVAFLICLRTCRFRVIVLQAVIFISLADINVISILLGRFRDSEIASESRLSYLSFLISACSSSPKSRTLNLDVLFYFIVFILVSKLTRIFLYLSPLLLLGTGEKGECGLR